MPPKKRQKVEESDEERSENENESESDNESGSDSGSGDDSDNGNGSDGGSDDDGSGSDDDNEDGDEEEEESEKPIAKGRGKAAAKKPATKATKTSAKKAVKATRETKANLKDKKKAKAKTKTKSSRSSSSSEPRLSKLKATKKSERLEEARKAYKWWEAPKLAANVNWKYLEHGGIKFAPAYVRHNVPLYYDGKPVELTDEQEEVATFFAAMPLDGPQLGNAKTRPVFQKNFFEDFQEVLGSGHVIKSFDLLDFSHIRTHLDMQKNLRKAATEEEKAAKKVEKEADFLRYGYALIDGRVEKVRIYAVPSTRVLTRFH